LGWGIGEKGKGKREKGKGKRFISIRLAFCDLMVDNFSENVIIWFSAKKAIKLSADDG
jgi:hypothetical protein